ncbi:hypothetical protein EK21DRAFT_54266 [Setomelanomma holmii]|uniref:DUF7918 domain-containing protein n=1 Tax=Setomelanomma holmii TaxID=210430 RepID=A0A9P4HLC4_9PLEO|nr:hypothetical protein EK21DRAFT_54266 [Setomelanomma holmii]
MAISGDHPGLLVEIIVDGRPLQEYEDEDAPPNTITKYVEASSGKEFAMKFTFSPPLPTQYGVEARVNIDGASIRVVSYAPDELYKPGGHTKSGVSYQENGQWFRQNYCFTALNIGEIRRRLSIQITDTNTSEVEEADVAASVAEFKKDLESKGSINISCRYITNIRPSHRQHAGTRVHGLDVMNDVPEKLLKGDARSHQATLSTPRRSRPRHRRPMYDYVEATSFVTFCFKYRSLAALNALHVIRNEGEDGDKAVFVEDIAEDEMTPAQLREALRRARRHEEASQRLKQENATTTSVKREHTELIADDDGDVTIVEARTRKRPRGEPEVIVLD